MKMALGSHGHVGKKDNLELEDEVFVTVMLDGSMTLECGDQMIELSSVEARLLRSAIG